MRFTMVFASAACAQATLASAQAAEVTLEFGKVRGNLLTHSQEFLGIPFAPKPERFAAAAPWTDKYPDEGLDATRYSTQCWQMGSYHPDLPMSEDCLQLNVYTPLPPGQQGKLPVMLWIHGGSLMFGTAMDAGFNGSTLAAAEGVIVVVPNYRLNIFGFGVFNGEEGPLGANNGLRDQAEAMRWVQNHIAAFGGDPERVTIFGESAGGQCVGYHVLSPKMSAGLFQRAIVESGSIGFTYSINEASNGTAAYAEALGCSDDGIFACLSRASAESLVNATAPPAWIVVDGDVLPAAPLDIIRSGEFNRVPLVIGNNAEEGNAFVVPIQTTVTADGLRRAAGKVFPAEVAARLLELYPVVDGADNTWILADMIGDVGFVCDNRRIARALSAAGAAPWSYSWRHRPSCIGRSPGGIGLKGATHGTEVNYVWRMPFFSRYETCEPVEDEEQLAERVSGLWAHFAREGTMDSRWPRFESPANEATLKLDLGLLEAFDTEMGYGRATCNVIEKLNVRLQDVFLFLGWSSYLSSSPAEVAGVQPRQLSSQVQSQPVVVV